MSIPAFGEPPCKNEREALIEFLKENLKIEADIYLTPYSDGCRELTIKLKLDDEIISRTEVGFTVGYGE
jgi:hypothetical protein